ncbi:Hypothetical protein SCLAV_1054 [Streptomyces clavuligerus]|uniref:Uncharacterized protein n=1 Tax=Streptomyces clavuligerus TaxID=1901 RepID=E2PXL0_STRCL|nr:Hypothetical protein SCLAV_1054 [Streptomyces clavuligerus]
MLTRPARQRAGWTLRQSPLPAVRVLWTSPYGGGGSAMADKSPGTGGYCAVA